MPSEVIRPSHFRRKKLWDPSIDPSLNFNVSSMFPISKYYNVIEKIHFAFYKAYLSGELDQAYIYGKRYATMAMISIPKHEYYLSPAHSADKHKSIRKSTEVIGILEKVVAGMDREEEERDRQQKKYAERLAAEEVSKERFDADLAMQGVHSIPNGGPSPRPSPAALSAPPTTPAPTHISAALAPPPPPFPPPSFKDISSEPSPPSYFEAMASVNGSTGNFIAPEYNNLPPSPMRKTKSFAVKELIDIYMMEFSDLKRKGKIAMYPLGTHQGKMREYNPMRDSTNGCAVIAPLISIHHMRSGGPGISDDVIERVIDDEAPPILRQVRQKLGLRSEALIVPSDVHDYLVDEKLLKQDQFVGVCGGNILDTEHLSSFYDLLEGKESVSKMAATLFFREHVVCILKMTRSNGEVCYDLVDSMPQDVVRGPPTAVRIRCKGLVTFKNALFWYASKKFTEDNCNYIDLNDWDEMMCEFDPRVFQAFVWKA